MGKNNMKTMERLSSSSSFQDVRNPIKLSSGCSKERYVLRQKYLRSYPLLMSRNEKENAVSRAKKWLKEMKKKYDFRENKPAGDEVKESSSSYVETCLKLLIVCMAKVDAAKIDDPKTIGFGI